MSETDVQHRRAWQDTCVQFVRERLPSFDVTALWEFAAVALVTIGQKVANLGVAWLFKYRNLDAPYVEVVGFLANTTALGLVLTLGTVNTLPLLARGTRRIHSAHLMYMKVVGVVFGAALLISLTGISRVLTVVTPHAVTLVLGTLFATLTAANISYYRLRGATNRMALCGLLPSILLWVAALATDITVIRALIAASWLPSALFVTVDNWLNGPFDQDETDAVTLREFVDLTRSHSLDAFAQSAVAAVFFAFNIFWAKRSFSELEAANLVFHYQLAFVWVAPAVLAASFYSFRWIRSLWARNVQADAVAAFMRRYGRVSALGCTLMAFATVIAMRQGHLGDLALWLYVGAAAMASHNVWYGTTLMGIGVFTGTWLTNIVLGLVSAAIVISGGFIGSPTLVASGLTVYYVLEYAVMVRPVVVRWLRSAEAP